MKATKRFLIIISLFLTSVSVFGQVDNSFFDEDGMIASNLPTSGPKENLQPIEFQNPRADDIFWQRVVYRVIDLREKLNFPLYFPEDASDGRQSLFALIFRLMQEGKIYGFDFDEAKEVFSEDFKVNFSELLEKYQIIHTSEVDPITNETVYIIDESDIPNREVLKFFLKEVWFFDKSTSIFSVKTLAICPVLSREDELGNLQRVPLFWVPFDMLRPHLAQTEVLISDRNNGMRMSYDDLFIKRRYGSYIYKASNVKNRSLLEFVSTAEQAKEEQNTISTGLINFEGDLWEY